MTLLFILRVIYTRMIKPRRRDVTAALDSGRSSIRQRVFRSDE
jgi:hypothetical protein